jgi:hypothetical protein
MDRRRWIGIFGFGVIVGVLTFLVYNSDRLLTAFLVTVGVVVSLIVANRVTVGKKNGG